MTSIAAMQDVPRAQRRVPSDLFGHLDVTDEQILSFAEGLLGFPTCTQWVLVDGVRAGTAWLQSADQPSLAFLLVDPFVLFEGFTADLDANEVRRLGANAPSELAVFSIVTLPGADREDATANLQGLVVINVRSRRGAQVLTGDGRWAVRQPLALASLKASS